MCSLTGNLFWPTHGANKRKLGGIYSVLSLPTGSFMFDMGSVAVSVV